jgi:hypothetical protein
MKKIFVSLEPGSSDAISGHIKCLACVWASGWKPESKLTNRHVVSQPRVKETWNQINRSIRTKPSQLGCLYLAASTNRQFIEAAGLQSRLYK